MSRGAGLRSWVADALTLSNGVFGFLSILTWSVELGPLSPLDDAVVAAAYIGLGMVADGLDGIVARAWGSTGLGNALDSMSDFLTFCVAPAVFLLEVVESEPGTAWASLVAAASLWLIVAGMFRLARHQDGDGATGHDPSVFVGLPAPWSGATLVVLLLAGGPSWLPVVAAIVLGALNVSHVPYPRTQGALTKAALGILAVALLVIAWIVVAGEPAGPAMVLAMVVSLGMVALAPVLAMRSS